MGSLKFKKGKEVGVMKRDWTKFQPKAIIALSKKQDRANVGRACCGGSCIGGNCKAIPKIANIFK